MRLGRMAIKPGDSALQRPKVIKLTLYGDPVGKAKPRVTRTRTGKSLTYTPSRTAQAEEQWKALFLESGEQPFPTGTPLALRLRAYLSRPQYLPRKVRLPITKPDLDNVAKLVTDALEGLAYHRDSNFVDITQSKRYAVYPDPPRVEIEISEAAEESGAMAPPALESGTLKGGKSSQADALSCAHQDRGSDRLRLTADSVALHSKGSSSAFQGG